MKKIVFDSDKHEILMYLDDTLCERILNIMFIAKDKDRKDYSISYEDISLLNLMFIFLNKYSGNNIYLLIIVLSVFL